ncbi:hypothetical protein ACE1AT_09610 [Pelatocladus sp. BLCC-F211]|uniref:hypothetical protein n=1 Tax=Pelatocladus sp. BLCC-F211 TaxID=3342752 RepID=UPI0035B81DFD
MIKPFALQSPLIQTSKFLSARKQQSEIAWDNWNPVDWDAQSSAIEVDNFDVIAQNQSEYNNVDIESLDIFTKIRATEPENKTKINDALIDRENISKIPISKKTDKSKSKLKSNSQSKNKKSKAASKIKKSKKILPEITTQIHPNESGLVVAEKILPTVPQFTENLTFTEEITPTQTEINLDSTTIDSVENKNIQKLPTSPSFEEQPTLFRKIKTDEQSFSILQTPSSLNSDNLQINSLNKEKHSQSDSLEASPEKEIKKFTEELNQQQPKTTDISINSTNFTPPPEDIDLSLLFSIINNQDHSSSIPTSHTVDKEGDEITDSQVEFIPKFPKDNRLRGDAIATHSRENQLSQSPSFRDTPTLFREVENKGELEVTDLSSPVTNSTISPTPETSSESTTPITPTLSPQLTQGEGNEITDSQAKFIPKLLKDNRLRGDAIATHSRENQPSQSPNFADTPTLFREVVGESENLTQNLISSQSEINSDSITNETGETHLNQEASPSPLISDSAEITPISHIFTSDNEVKTPNIFSNVVSEEKQLTPTFLSEDATFEIPPSPLNKERGSSSVTSLNNGIISEFTLAETHTEAFTEIQSQDIANSSNKQEQFLLFAIDEQTDIEILPTIKGYATGGQVKNSQHVDHQQIPSSDTVPAMLTPGEFVINVRDTQENLDLLEHINSGGEPEEFIYPDSQLIQLPEKRQQESIESIATKVESLPDISVQQKSSDSLISPSWGQKIDKHQISVLNTSPLNSFENHRSEGSEVITNYSSPPLIFRSTKPPIYTPSQRVTHTPYQWNSIEDLLNGGSDELNIFNFEHIEFHRPDLDNDNISKSSSSIPNILPKHLPRLQSFDNGGKVTHSELATEAEPITEIIEKPSFEQEEDDDSAELETLAREIYNRLRQRLEIERERQGIYYGRLPW